jgi:hypothetical protein
MFWASSCLSSGAATAAAASGLQSEVSDSSAVGRGRANRPDHDQLIPPRSNGKPEAAAVVGIFMPLQRNTK